ncbi:MAG: dienelactone hydrolase family protein [Chloroflexi bacterium]|nr:MAG: dienelactone hydrolase family protein [Chloroflexota bacterium]
MCVSPDDYQDPGTPKAARESERRLQADDGASIRLFTAEPEGGLGAGAVLIIHDIWGYTDFYKDLARRIAAEGYAGVLIDLFARQGDLPPELRTPERKPATADAMALARDRAAKASEDRILKDIQLAVDDLQKQGAPRVVCWGFCWGGTVTYMAGARVRGLAGVIAYYGFLKVGPPRTSPLDIVDQIQVPVLGIFGGADPGIPLEQIADFEFRLEKAGKTAQIEIYEGMPHGFIRYNPSEHQVVIDDALRKTFEFLDQILRAFATNVPPPQGEGREGMRR